MAKPILDADGMADYTEGMSRLERSQVLELWRLQQFEAGHRAAEDVRKRHLEEQRQYAAGRADGKRETEEAAAKAEPEPSEYPYPVLTQFIVELDRLRDMGAEL